MNIVFIHNTPLALLAAYVYTGYNGAKPVAPVGNDEWPIQPPGFYAVGRNAHGHEVFALWLPFPGKLVARLVDSWMAMNAVSSYCYRLVQLPSKGILKGLVCGGLYRMGHKAAALRLMAWRYPLGIDDLELLVDNG